MVFLTKTLEKFSFTRVNKLIFLSSSERDLVMSSLDINPNNFCVIYPAIKGGRLTSKFKNKEIFTVVFVGRLVPIKGLDKLISSFKLLPLDAQKHIRYLIVGDGFYKSTLKSLTNNLKLNKKIIFSGYTDNIYRYLNQSDIFILPSQGGEGLPVSLLEAMSVGLPCLVSNFNEDINSS